MIENVLEKYVTYQRARRLLNDSFDKDLQEYYKVEEIFNDAENQLTASIISALENGIEELQLWNIAPGNVLYYAVKEYRINNGTW
jgi:hypothetical protein